MQAITRQTYTNRGSIAGQAQYQPVQSNVVEHENLTNISAKLSEALHQPLTESEEMDVIKMCLSHLGGSEYKRRTSLAHEEFKQRENELLDLALEFHLNGNSQAVQIIERGFNLGHSSFLRNPELELYTGPSFFYAYTFPCVIRDAAQDGRKVAQFTLGTMYLEGKKGVEKNVDLAAKYLQSSADQGYLPAIEALEKLFKSNYILAEGLENTDSQQALKLYRQAASEDDMNAMFFLGELSRKDPTKAIIYFTQADKAGHPGAALQLAEIFATQYKECTFKFMNTSLRDDAIRYYRKSSEASATFKFLEFQADTGDKEAQYQVGKLYLSGSASNLPSQNFSRGEHYLKLAADAGHTGAAYTLSNEYLSNEYLSFSTSSVAGKLHSHYHAIAVKGKHPIVVLEKKAENGDVESMLSLYKLHSTGAPSLSLTPNQKKAEAYLFMAADQRNIEALRLVVQLSDQGILRSSFPLDYYCKLLAEELAKQATEVTQKALAEIKQSEKEAPKTVELIKIEKPLSSPKGFTHFDDL